MVTGLLEKDTFLQFLDDFSDFVTDIALVLPIPFLDKSRKVIRASRVVVHSVRREEKLDRPDVRDAFGLPGKVRNEVSALDVPLDFGDDRHDFVDEDDASLTIKVAEEDVKDLGQVVQPPRLELVPFGKCL